MEVRIKDKEGYVDADWTIEDGVMVVSPKEVKFEPKDGDVVACDSYLCLELFIFKEWRDDSECECHCYYNEKNGNLYIGGDDYVVTRYATEEEKKKLFDKLAEEGYEWKPVTKELVKLKWKPMAGQRYYIPVICNAQFKAVIEDWSDDALDVLYFGKGWAFRTEEECQELCNRLNDAINSVKP